MKLTLKVMCVRTSEVHRRAELVRRKKIAMVDDFSGFFSLNGANT